MHQINTGKYLNGLLILFALTVIPGSPWWTQAIADDMIGAYQNRGLSFLRKGCFGDAYEAYEQALRLACSQDNSETCMLLRDIVDIVGECRDKGFFSAKLAAFVLEPSDCRYKGLGGKGSREQRVGAYFAAVLKNTMPILFVVGKTAFLNNRAALNQIGIYARSIQRSQAAYFINGYASDEGSEAFNLALSRQRAQKVALIMIEQHAVSPNQLEVKWFGEDPRYFYTPVAGLCGAELEHARIENRRVTIRLKAD